MSAEVGKGEARNATRTVVERFLEHQDSPYKPVD